MTSASRKCWTVLATVVGVLLVSVALFGSPFDGRFERSKWRQLSFSALRRLRLDGGHHSKKLKGAAVSDPYAPHPDPYVVPNLVHFVFGLDPTFGHIKFGLIHYMAVLGAAMYIQPTAINWHYKYEPPADNMYWQCAKPHLKLIQVEDVTHVHGRPMTMRVQHRADILRMQIMLNIGGMYLDSDVVPLRSFEDLRRSNLTMGLEGAEGLCNAVMVGAPNTSFIRRWWEEYKTFDPGAWAYHSVLLPRILQRRHPDEVQVLSEKAFFYPSWIHLTPMYDADDGYDYHDNYAVHLWTSADPNKQALLGGLTVEQVFTGKGSFQKRARKLLAEAHDKKALCAALDAQVVAALKAASG